MEISSTGFSTTRSTNIHRPIETQGHADDVVSMANSLTCPNAIATDLC